jgi:hypothetical protein
MANSDERMKILQMLQEGRLTPESAAQLLQAVDEAPAARPVVSPPEPVTIVEGQGSPNKPRWLRVRVTDTDTGRPRVNVRLPISLVNVGLKLGSQFAPEIEGVDFAQLIEAANSGETGAFVDVFDEEDGEHVEVFLE